MQLRVLFTGKESELYVMTNTIRRNVSEELMKRIYSFSKAFNASEMNEKESLGFDSVFINPRFLFYRDHIEDELRKRGISEVEILKIKKEVEILSALFDDMEFMEFIPLVVSIVEKGDKVFSLLIDDQIKRFTDDIYDIYEISIKISSEIKYDLYRCFISMYEIKNLIIEYLEKNQAADKDYLKDKIFEVHKNLIGNLIIKGEYI